jgi:hypothetical protein
MDNEDLPWLVGWYDQDLNFDLASAWGNTHFPEEFDFAMEVRKAYAVGFWHAHVAMAARKSHASISRYEHATFAGSSPIQVLANTSVGVEGNW